MDVRKVTDVSDCMVLASGNSDRHVRSIADRVVERVKAAGFRPIGVEGQRDGEWVLVDLNDVLVHVMLPRVREFYGLEELWEPPQALQKTRAKGKVPGKAVARKTAAAASRPSGNSRPARSGAAKRAGASKPRPKKTAAARGARPRT
jgi:ribosome-associated protein